MHYDYDIIVIGGGSAGLGSSGALAHLGARVCVVEKTELGGECLHTGCVPSKALLAAAKAWHAAGRLDEFGLPAQPRAVVNLGDVMKHVSGVVDGIQAHETPELLYSEHVERVVFGAATFLDANTIEVDGQRMTAKKFVVCTGSRPMVPPIPGLEGVSYLTNENVFDLAELPPRLAVIGAGPIGCEMAQAFSRLGSEVVVIDLLDRILAHDDSELASSLQAILEAEGIRFLLSAKVDRVEPSGNGVRIFVATENGQEQIDADAVLVAVGRRPNVEGLGLEPVGIETKPQGIVVDKHLRTTLRNVWALGDVNGLAPFSHMAEAQVRAVASNIAFGLPGKFDPATTAWATFTDPELASVGLTEEQARKQHGRVRVLRFPVDRVDRALAERRTHGEIKVVVAGWRGRVVGAQILAAGAGDLLQEWVTAVGHKLKVWQVSNDIHVYPGWGLLNQRAADQFAKEWSEKPAMRTWLRRVYRWLG